MFAFFSTNISELMNFELSSMYEIMHDVNV